MSNHEDQYVSDIQEEIYEEDKYGVLSSEGSGELGPQMMDADVLATEMLVRSEVGWSFGPLRIEASFRGTTVSVTIYLLGVRVASATLDARNPALRVSVNLGVARVRDLEVRADFTQRTLSAAGRVCVRMPPFRWRCRSFRVTILRW
jgi:hypothetical protein